MRPAITNGVLGFWSHVCSLMHDETLRVCFGLASYWLLRLMQAMPGEIKTLVILISNEMPDESTDQNTIQPTYRLTTCLTVMSSITSGQGTNDDRETIFTRGWRWIRPKASATESLYILVGLALKLGHCITVFELSWNIWTVVWFVKGW